MLSILFTLLIALSAIDRSTLNWFERDFSFFAAFRAFYFMHFAWAAESRLPIITQIS